MEAFYTSERNTQILISLMKAHGIRKVVASPGTTNISFVGSIQQDPYFEIFSSVDERSAAYLACGIANESGEPVALSCTGATASRNYVSGLTEAFYRKLPILAITSTQNIARIGHNVPQVIDRTNIMNDIAKFGVTIPSVDNEEDEWECVVGINKALLELKHKGTGPVHINLTTRYSMDFSVRELPETRVIRRIEYNDEMPEIEKGRVGIFVGAHQKWTKDLTNVVERFCEIYDGVVLCDHTSNYKGKYKIDASLVCSQEQYKSPARDVNLLIHIGDISGSAISMFPKMVWRVNPDGEIRDTFKKLTYVFEMEEGDFFKRYVNGKEKSGGMEYAKEWQSECEKIIANIPELPFSNAWIAKKTIGMLPKESVLYLGILNSLRTWNYYALDDSINCYSNTGGFGIDGGVSSLMGASLVSRDKLFIGITGDLAFFYDMNVLGNRHIGSNVRLMIVNNGRGTEFRNYNHNAAKFGEDADDYMAAAGHYGNKSKDLTRHFASDLGYEYISASNKEDFDEKINQFLSTTNMDKSIVFEVFTDSVEESEAIRIMNNLEVSAVSVAKKMAKEILGEKGIKTIKNLIKR